MSGLSLYIVCNARRQFISAHCSASIDEVQALRPDWRALHRSLAGQCWELFQPEGHIVLRVYAFEFTASPQPSPARAETTPRFMRGDPNRDAA